MQIQKYTSSSESRLVTTPRSNECSSLFQHSTFSSRCICKYGYLVEKLEYFSFSNIISSISYLSSFLFSSIQCQFICPVRLRLRVVSACNYHKKIYQISTIGVYCKLFQVSFHNFFLLSHTTVCPLLFLSRTRVFFFQVIESESSIRTRARQVCP